MAASVLSCLAQGCAISGSFCQRASGPLVPGGIGVAACSCCAVHLKQRTFARHSLAGSHQGRLAPRLRPRWRSGARTRCRRGWIVSSCSAPCATAPPPRTMASPTCSQAPALCVRVASAGCMQAELLRALPANGCEAQWTWWHRLFVPHVQLSGLCVLLTKLSTAGCTPRLTATSRWLVYGCAGCTHVLTPGYLQGRARQCPMAALRPGMRTATPARRMARTRRRSMAGSMAARVQPSLQGLRRRRRRRRRRWPTAARQGQGIG